MRIADVVPVDDYILFVETEEGTSGVFYIKPYLGGEAFVPLRDHTEFSAVHNGGYFLEWPCGADLIRGHHRSPFEDCAARHRPTIEKR